MQKSEEKSRQEIITIEEYLLKKEYFGLILHRLVKLRES